MRGRYIQGCLAIIISRVHVGAAHAGGGAQPCTIRGSGTACLAPAGATAWTTPAPTDGWLTAASGNNYRQLFCPSCGNPVMGDSSGRPHARVIRLGDTPERRAELAWNACRGFVS